MTDIKNIKTQSKFCMDLMKRLDGEIEQAKMTNWNVVEKHDRMRDDIKRLRRELMALSKMLDPWRAEP